MSDKLPPEPKQSKTKSVSKINIKSQQPNNTDLILVLNRIANALEEKNLREEKLFKLEEKIKKFELMEARENYKNIVENNNNKDN